MQLRRAAAVFLSVSLAASAAAQVRSIPGTGCVSTPFSCVWSGESCLGKTMSFGSVCVSGTPFVIFGAKLASPVLFPPGLACDPLGCFLACTLDFVAPADPAQPFRLRIPRDAGLIGQSFCIQCGCVDVRQGLLCIELLLGLEITIQPAC